MKNIFLIPTDKPSNIIKINKDDSLTYFKPLTGANKNNCTNQNIYITSNEEEEGDWCIDTKRNIIFQSKKTEIGTSKKIPIIICTYEGCYIKKDCKKIILTTDQDLIEDGVQAIDDEFLKWFVKNPSCEGVEVSEDYFKPSNIVYGHNTEHYKIIFPQEEPKQTVQEYEQQGLEKYLHEPKQEKTFEDVLDESLAKGKVILEELKARNTKQETLEEVIFKVPFDYNIKPKEVIDMCMKEQENIILTWRLGRFIDMINSLPDDTEKNRILKSVFNNREGELLLESYKSMKLHYEK